MQRLLFTAVLLAFASGTRAADTLPAPSIATNSVPPKIASADASAYYDREVIVTGRVAQVSIRPGVTFLDLDKAYPDSPLSVVIIHGSSHFHGDAEALKGRAVEIRGTVKQYHNKPEIVLDDVRQLTVFDDRGNVITSAILNPTNAPAMLPRTNAAPPRPLPPATPTNHPQLLPPTKTSTNLPEIM